MWGNRWPRGPRGRAAGSSRHVPPPCSPRRPSRIDAKSPAPPPPPPVPAAHRHGQSYPRHSRFWRASVATSHMHAESRPRPPCVLPARGGARAPLTRSRGRLGGCRGAGGSGDSPLGGSPPLLGYQSVGPRRFPTAAGALPAAARAAAGRNRRSGCCMDRRRRIAVWSHSSGQGPPPPRAQPGAGRAQCRARAVRPVLPAAAPIARTQSVPVPTRWPRPPRRRRRWRRRRHRRRRHRRRPGGAATKPQGGRVAVALRGVHTRVRWPVTRLRPRRELGRRRRRSKRRARRRRGWQRRRRGQQGRAGTTCGVRSASGAPRRPLGPHQPGRESRPRRRPYRGM